MRRHFLFLFLRQSDILFLNFFRLGLSVSHVFPSSVLQASRRELLQGKDGRFLLHALVWCHCFNRNCSCRGDDTLCLRVICKDHIPEQFIDFYDGQLLCSITPFLTRLCFMSQSFFFHRSASFYVQVYVWSKQNPFIHMSFLGLFTFTAAYLPWVSVYYLIHHTLLHKSLAFKFNSCLTCGLSPCIFVFLLLDMKLSICHFFNES